VTFFTNSKTVSHELSNACSEHRKDLDEVDVIVVGALGRRVVDSAQRELVLDVIDDARGVEVGENRQQTSSVPVVGHTSAVVTLTSQVGDCVVGHLVVLVDKHLQSR